MGFVVKKFCFFLFFFGFINLVYADGDNILATLSEGELITERDYLSYIQRRADLRTLARSFWGARSAVEEMAVTRTLMREGERLGVARDDRPQGLRFDDVYADRVYRALVKECQRPTDPAEAKKYYDRYPDAFILPAQARVLRLMVPVNANIDNESSLGWLLRAAQSIASGSSSFDDWASKASVIYPSEKQGDIGWILLGDASSIMKAIDDAKVGDVLGPVREGDFIYIFRVLDKRSAQKLTWDQVSGFAATRIVEHCRESERKRVIKELFERYDVRINSVAIRELFQSRQEQ